MLLFDLPVIDTPMTHQRDDHIAAQPIVVTQLVATVHRQHAVVQSRVVLRELLDVLAVAVGDLADGGNAQPDQVAVGMGGVALEVALQGTVGAGQGQLVLG